jgi:adenylate cyclase
VRPPEESAALLHAFFSRAVRIVEAHGGVVEAFQGDAVIAIWNATEPTRRHPQQALEAALALLREIPALFPSSPPEGLEPLAIGVGMETGTALVGSVGPASRRHHTALGETVTVAVRLQAMTADLAQPLLVGPGAAARLPAASLASLGEFLLEGLTRSYTLYALPPKGNAAE